MLQEVKHKKIEDVWKCCIYIYSLESYVYKIINSTMRLIGSKEDEQKWQEKIQTLGPFCLLLWDDPINEKPVISGTLYRGADLKPEQIAAYKNMIGKDEYGSFQAFSSSSRNRKQAEEFGNVLFIMEIGRAFIADISQLSEYPNEEEALIAPGVCFKVKQIEFDQEANKHLIHMELVQRFSAPQKGILSTYSKTNGNKTQFDRSDTYGLLGNADGYADYDYGDAYYYDRDGNFIKSSKKNDDLDQ